MGICGAEGERHRKIKRKNYEENISGTIEGKPIERSTENIQDKNEKLKAKKKNIDIDAPIPEINEDYKKELFNKKKEEIRLSTNGIKSIDEIKQSINNEEKQSNDEVKTEIENNENKSEKNSKIEDKNSNINYDDLDINDEYYIACPKCRDYIPHIENADYDNEKNDFQVEYICPCDSSDNKKNICYLRKLITKNEPKDECINHEESKLILFCKNCNKKICEKCKEEEHKEHQFDYNDILSNEKSDDIFKIALEKKDQFKGFNIFKKLFEKFKGNTEIKRENLLKNENKSYKEEEEEKNKEIYLGGSQNGNQVYEDDLEKYYQEKREDDNKSKNGNENKSKDNISKNIIDTGNNIINKDYEEMNIENIKEIDSPKINNINEDKVNDTLLKKEIENGDSKLKSNLTKIPVEESELRNNIFPPNNIINGIKPADNDNNGNDYNNLFNDKIEESYKEYKCIKTIIGHTEKVVSLIELESGNLASGSYDDTICIWDVNNGNCLNKIKEMGHIFSLLEFEKNKLLVSNSQNHINLWDLSFESSNPIYCFKGHGLWVNSLVKCNDKIFASAGNDANIIIWDYYQRKYINYLQGHIDCILTLIKLNDGKLCSGSADLTIKIWDWGKSLCVATLKNHKKWVKCLCQLNDGTLISGSDDRTINIWKDYEYVTKIKQHSNSIRTLCQINDNYFASGSFDNSIKIWDLNNYNCVQTLTDHIGNVIAIIKLHDNKLVSCSCDKTIKIWENN